jgi:hypothetical protein
MTRADVRHFQTSSRIPTKSVCPATADMRRLRRHVGFVPATWILIRLDCGRAPLPGNRICMAVARGEHKCWMSTCLPC